METCAECGKEKPWYEFLTYSDRHYDNDGMVSFGPAKRLCSLCGHH